MRHFSGCRWLGFAALLLGCSSNDGSASSGSPADGDGEQPGAAHDTGHGSADAKGSAAPAGSPSGPTGSAPTIEPGIPGTSAGVSEGSPASPATGDGNVGENQVGPGILTSGVWDDNRNFNRFLGYRSGLVAASLHGVLPITESELKKAHELWLQPPVAKQTLDIALIVDTTGSMGDEIAYLQSEFVSLSTSISKAHPSADQRWSLVLYRDVLDDYVTRWFDFRDDAEGFRAHLAEQSADGGGDFPESPERGFEAAERLSWRTDGSTARLAFWVADAPHHDARASDLAAALRAMQALGVHVYPVAASGVDELTELTMRTSAALTGGRYVFLTNDSGVGGDHKEPTIPCYFVTKLDSAIERMVDIELSGKYREPDPSEVLRAGGNPADGACTLDSGEITQVF